MIGLKSLPKLGTEFRELRHKNDNHTWKTESETEHKDGYNRGQTSDDPLEHEERSANGCSIARKLHTKETTSGN